ncbi:amidohydrolase family protein [Nocardioides campestrisoli]|uniref:amidohydrolase family protein n=1 Tax=Nocardioides campestrisoli TaxID=2736757 RepID=UPI0028127842|nr:amidohydrolase family protein [Nocardioides campestrisoli]
MTTEHASDPSGPTRIRVAGQASGDEVAGDAADVRAWTERLGLPGLFDVHTHFLPPRVMEKVRAQFDSAGPLIGRTWPLRYRDSDAALARVLTSFGVRHFSALPYAHKPQMAEFLNDWADEFAARTPGALRCGTFFPEPGAADYVRRRIDAGLELFKVHVQVGAFRVTDPLLDEAWGVVAEAGTPVVLHAGSGPIPTEHTGPGPVAQLLARHPRLRLVIAHMGAPEYAEFLNLAETYEHVRLDTTMAFTDFFTEMGGPFPSDLLPRVADLGEKVLLGSDFPNIPYPYVHQLESLERLAARHPGLGEPWLRAVCWENAVRLFAR